MRRFLSWVVGFAIVVPLAGAPAQAGYGYRDTGFDPNDVSESDFVVDVRSSTRKVWQDDHGNRWLTITIRAHDSLSGHFEVVASIDAQGGPIRESHAVFVAFEGDQWCYWTNGDDGSILPLRIDGPTATCRIPMRLIEPTKRIRWRLRSPHPESQSQGLVDRAPNTGWYV